MIDNYGYEELVFYEYDVDIKKIFPDLELENCYECNENYEGNFYMSGGALARSVHDHWVSKSYDYDFFLKDLSKSHLFRDGVEVAMHSINVYMKKEFNVPHQFIASPHLNKKTPEENVSQFDRADTIWYYDLDTGVLKISNLCAFALSQSSFILNPWCDVKSFRIFERLKKYDLKTDDYIMLLIVNKLANTDMDFIHTIGEDYKDVKTSVTELKKKFHDKSIYLLENFVKNYMRQKGKNTDHIIIEIVADVILKDYPEFVF